MARSLLSKEEAINQLYVTIKTKFEQDGVLQEVRCLLQAKMVDMMKDRSETNTLVQRSHTSSSASDYAGDARIALLHQLIMEYLHWHGFHYSAQMFSLESACDNARPMRQCLETILGHSANSSVPILLQLVAELMEKQQHNANNDP